MNDGFPDVAKLGILRRFCGECDRHELKGHAIPRAKWEITNLTKVREFFCLNVLFYFAIYLRAIFLNRFDSL